MKLRVFALILLIVLSAGCIHDSSGGSKELKPLSFEVVAGNSTSFNSSVLEAYRLFLEVHRNYLSNRGNHSIDLTKELPVVLVRMKNGSRITAFNLSDNVFVLAPTDENRIYTCHCADGSVVGFRVKVTKKNPAVIRDYYVNYDVRKLGDKEYNFSIIEFTVTKVTFDGRNYTIRIYPRPVNIQTPNVIINSTDGIDFLVRVRGEPQSDVEAEFGFIPLVISDGTRNATITTLPLDFGFLEKGG